MPTVLDHLRENLLGDEVADRLEQWLEARVAMIEANPVIPHQTQPTVTGMSLADSQSLAGLRGLFEEFLKIVGMTAVFFGQTMERWAQLPPSPGYEPLLVEAGWNRALARGAASVAVRHGKQMAKESKWQRPVYDAIRFLAKGQRQRRAILRCVGIFRQARQVTSIIETIFNAAGESETEFFDLLQAVRGRRDVDRRRITTIAAAVSRRLSLPRGPKMSAASAAHEYLFGQKLDLLIKRRPYLGRDRIDEYVDPRTEATRREFGDATFKSRAATRRLKNRATTKPAAR